MIIFIFFTLLFARVNPFEPVILPDNLLRKTPNYFKEKRVYLPNSARVLKEVIFVYEDINSDIKKKSVKIDKDIDFHYPLILSHPRGESKELRVDISPIKLILKDKKVKIVTKNPLKRSFFLLDPFRIVLDFKSSKTFYTQKKDLNSFLKRVVVGSHSGFFRVVLYFDTRYRYRVLKKSDGVEIELY